MYEDDIAFNQFLQFIFYGQWVRLKRYANAKGVEIMGDIPFYVGLDSVDVWANRQYFLLDEQCEPTHVGGVPPDYFHAQGQRWGNPIYDWAALERDGFGFWIERLRLNQKVFDSIRLDHFRAFDTYWKIPAREETAVLGEWVEAPGYAFFDKLFQVLPDSKIFVEDLGNMRPEVFELRDHYHFMGMDILQFSFGEDMSSAKKKTRENRIAYTGTHDNQTTLGWFLSLPQAEQEKMRQHLAELGYDGSISQQMIQYTLGSSADIAIIPIWDILGLDDSARMNTPGTVGSPNWEWKLANYDLLEEKWAEYAQWLRKCGRTAE
ncbi:MAG: 4-alpha-glucanotransferase, partial [Oscillospiraceae bacterium]|nr:4-alpha-glucanotransferase [Oscillospiraceae bacterium]